MDLDPSLRPFSGGTSAGFLCAALAQDLRSLIMSDATSAIALNIHPVYSLLQVDPAMYLPHHVCCCSSIGCSLGLSALILPRRGSCWKNAESWAGHHWVCHTAVRGKRQAFSEKSVRCQVRKTSCICAPPSCPAGVQQATAGLTQHGCPRLRAQPSQGGSTSASQPQDDFTTFKGLAQSKNKVKSCRPRLSSRGRKIPVPQSSSNRDTLRGRCREPLRQRCSRLRRPTLTGLFFARLGLHFFFT